MADKAMNRIPITPIAMALAAVILTGAWFALWPDRSVEAFDVSITSGRIKVCKITADPTNIPIGTLFTVQIIGTAASAPNSPNTTYTFDFPAGPPAQGGFCAFAPDTWVSGTPVFIGDKGISAANTVTLPLGTAATQAALRVSSVTSNTTFLSPAQAAAAFPNLAGLSNPEFRDPAAGYVGHAVINAGDATSEVGFTNFVYRPAILKVCNTSRNIPVGTLTTFTIAPVDPLTTWRYPAGPITIQVGSCTFVDGPFPAIQSLPDIETFNFGTSIVVTENPAPGTAVISITSPTLVPSGTLTADLLNRRGTLTLNQAASPYYLFNELDFNTSMFVEPPPPRPSVRFDFNGDGSSDITVFRPLYGNWYYIVSGSSGVRGVGFGLAGDVPVAADFDGDGTTDPAVYRNGVWYVLGSTSGIMSASFGLATDIPQPADFDGDGKADFAVYRRSVGTWYTLQSHDGMKAVKFGIDTDSLVAADFDGDGRTDPAVYRDGTWYIYQSPNRVKALKFGLAGDVPAQADYDGDGIADFAVYRRGTWYILTSASGFRVVKFGIAEDTPTPADYDGDGKTDIGVYRSSNHTWYILLSSQASNPNGGFSAVQFGLDGDVLMRY